MRLSHDNILPFYGVDMKFFKLSLVYDLGTVGNIRKYAEEHPGLQLQLVSKPLPVTARDIYLFLFPVWIVVRCSKGTGVPSRSGHHTWWFKRGEFTY